jgi:hypothetical protein
MVLILPGVTQSTSYDSNGDGAPDTTPKTFFNNAPAITFTLAGQKMNVDTSTLVLNKEGEAAFGSEDHLLASNDDEISHIFYYDWKRGTGSGVDAQYDWAQLVQFHLDDEGKPDLSTTEDQTLFIPLCGLISGTNGGNCTTTEGDAQFNILKTLDELHFAASDVKPFALTRVSAVSYTSVAGDGTAPFKLDAVNDVDETSVGTLGGGLLNGIVNLQFGTKSFDVHKETVKHILSNGDSWEADFDSKFITAYDGVITSMNDVASGALVAAAINDSHLGRLEANSNLDTTELQELQGADISAFRPGDQLCIKLGLDYKLGAYVAGNGKGVSTTETAANVTVLVVVTLVE